MALQDDSIPDLGGGHSGDVGICNFYGLLLSPQPQWLTVEAGKGHHESNRTHRLKDAFGAELRESNASRLLDVLAVLSHHSNFSVGGYCGNEKYCHRSILRHELRKRGAAVKRTARPSLRSTLPSRLRDEHTL